PKIKQVYDELQKKLEDHKTQLEKVTNNIKSLKSRADHLNEKEQDLLKRLVPAFHKLRSDIESDTAKVGFLKEKMDKLTSGRCRVRGKTYPGVKIISQNSSMVVRSEVNHSSFYEQNEQIIVGPY
ncbi:MAG: FapA family protein, partial [bacterium]